MVLRDAILVLAGAAVAVGALLTVQRFAGPASFNECVLAESKGRSDKVLRVVGDLCRKRFPAQLSDKDIWPEN